MDCHCNSQKKFNACCRPYLSGKAHPRTPEALMRSRYAAFCTGDVEYLVATCHPSRRQPGQARMIARTCRQTRWLGLKILKTGTAPSDPSSGFVEFAAFYKDDPVGQLHERSSFIRENGQWYYLDGEILAPLKLRRNEPCWCGSLKKYKKCHGRHA